MTVLAPSRVKIREFVFARVANQLGVDVYSVNDKTVIPDADTIISEFKREFAGGNGKANSFDCSETFPLSEELSVISLVNFIHGQ